MDDTTHTLSLGHNAVVMPLGFGVLTISHVVAFDDDLVGLLFKALPDDLAGVGTIGQPVSDEHMARMQEISDEAPTLLIRAKDPAALDNLAATATKLAAEWRDWLEAN